AWRRALPWWRVAKVLRLSRLRLEVLPTTPPISTKAEAAADRGFRAARPEGGPSRTVHRPRRATTGTGWHPPCASRRATPARFPRSGGTRFRWHRDRRRAPHL